MRRTKPPEQRRDELMNAAQALFLGQRIAPTTIEQISSGAGVAKGSFYLHFSSKEDLLAALGARFARQHLACITAAVSSKAEQDWTGKLATWVEASATFHFESKELHDMLSGDSGAPMRQGAVDHIVIAHLSELLRSGAVAGAWSIDDPRFSAVFIFSGLHRIVDEAHLEERPIVQKRVIERLHRICFAALGLPSEITSV